MKAIRLCATFGVIGILAACAQQEEPGRVNPEPVYDKFGGGSCEGDWIYVRGTAQRPDRCVPPDECDDPQYNSAGQLIDCIPPQRTPGGSDNNGRTPTRQTPGTPLSSAPIR